MPGVLAVASKSRCGRRGLCLLKPVRGRRAWKDPEKWVQQEYLVEARAVQGGAGLSGDAGRASPGPRTSGWRLPVWGLVS